MSCFRPLKVFRSLEKNPATGKHLLTFNPLKAMNSTNPITIPCSRCNGCLCDRAQQWAARCMHEAQMHEHNSFITNTYDNQYLPENYSLSVREWQLFMKRLRKEIEPTKIRYYASGEYGPQTFRPHYHALIFGYAFPDRKFHSRNRDGQPLYESKILQDAWSLGQCLIGDVDYKSARYVAGYCTKKIFGDKAAEHYHRQHPVSLQYYQVEPEFSLMSGKPGIGASWFDKFKGDCFPSDFLVVDGHQTMVPRYYFQKLQEEEREKLNRKRKLKGAAPNKKWNRTSERLKVREEVHNSKTQRMSRSNIKDNE